MVTHIHPTSENLRSTSYLAHFRVYVIARSYNLSAKQPATAWPSPESSENNHDTPTSRTKLPPNINQHHTVPTFNSPNQNTNSPKTLAVWISERKTDILYVGPEFPILHSQSPKTIIGKKSFQFSFSPYLIIDSPPHPTTTVAPHSSPLS